MQYKNCHITFIILLFVGLCMGCEKEYSDEGSTTVEPALIDTTVIITTPVVTIDPGALPNCPACNAAIDTVGAWRFNTGNSILCGRIDTAIILNLERSTFTFFGPATCGADTGIIFTVSLGTHSLAADIVNIAATNAVFYYYHTNAPYVLLGHADQPFNFTILSYDHSTKIIKGIFSGTGFRADGRAVQVTNGKFSCKIN
jgi:hypothetical protein